VRAVLHARPDMTAPDALSAVNLVRRSSTHQARAR
jgi:hypothetical protein